MIKFTCTGCIFSLQDKNKQVGCHLNRLSKFQEKGAVLDEKIDSHYVLNRICKSARTKDWKWFDEDLETQKIKQEEENFLKFSFIVIHDDNSSEEDLHKTLNSIANMGNHSIFIISSKEEDLSSIEKVLGHSNYFFLALREKNVTWSLHLLKNIKKSYCVLTDSGYLFHHNFCAEINDLVNKELEPMLAILPDEENPFVLHSDALNIFRDINVALDELTKKAQENNPTVFTWDKAW